MTPACGRSGLLLPFCYTIEDDMSSEFKQGTGFFLQLLGGDGCNC